MNSEATYSTEPFHMDEQVLDDQLELIYSSSVQTTNVAWKTRWKQWTLETSSEGESGKSVLEARHDNDMHEIIFFKYSLKFLSLNNMTKNLSNIMTIKFFHLPVS